MANKKYNLSTLKIERLEWKNVLVDVLDNTAREAFLSRKKAVDMYIDGFTLKEIEDKTNINKVSINKYVEKCRAINPQDNQPYGYGALLHYKHTSKKVSNKINTTSSNKGNFEALLLHYPQLQSFIYDNYFGNKKDTLEKNMKVSILHKKFLTECRQLGIQDYEYPFNTDSKASRSLQRYINELRNKNESKTINRESKDAQQRFNSTGKGQKYSSEPIIPYSVVQLDGHKIDMLYSVEVIHSDGSITYLPATRMWLIAIIDVSTRAILGYSLSTQQNYNQTDVLAAIKDAMCPRVPIEFSIPGFEYPSNGGFPSFAIKEVEWAMFENIMLDNAKSHLAHDVVSKLTERLGCAVNFGSVATPETRGIVERFFYTLEENGYHRIVSTTGSNIQDTRRLNAEKDASKYQVTYNDIVELTEYLIAKYNNSPHSALSGRTPLQVLENRVINAGIQPYIAYSKQKETINSLTNIIIERTVRGSYKNGKRPYISYEGVEYRNEILSITTSLVGTKVFLDVNPSDISSILAYTEDGIELGYLRAVGDWGLHPHSLRTRKNALKAIRKNTSENEPFFVSLVSYEEELKKRATKSRVARTQQNTIIREKQNTDSIKGITKTATNTQDLEVDISTKKREIKSNTRDYTINQHDELDGLSFEEAYEKGLFK